MSWIAVRGIDRDELLVRLGAEETDVICPEGEAGVEGLTLGETEKGWLVVCSDDVDFPSGARLAALSEGGQTVGCFLEEHTMASGAWGYRDGQEVWSVLYDCDKRLHELQVGGNPPAELQAIRAQAEAEQAKPDDGLPTDYIFDVPVDLVEAICGFRIGVLPEPEFIVLIEHRPRPRGLFKRLSSWMRKSLAPNGDQG